MARLFGKDIQLNDYAATGLRAAFFTFLIDQCHKWWMIAFYKIGPQDRIALTPFLDLVFTKNKGVSYGMFAQDGHGGQWVLATFAAAVAAAMLVWLAYGSVSRSASLGFGLIAGGALGNALDRVLIGGVADFFSLHAFGFYWYIFNIADVAIVAGVVALLYDSFRPNHADAAKST